MDSWLSPGGGEEEVCRGKGGWLQGRPNYDYKLEIVSSAPPPILLRKEKGWKWS